ncbi:MAG: hypothetical protein ABIJ85_03535 [bacterium]
MKNSNMMVNQRSTTHIRIDKGMYRLLQKRAKIAEMTAREFLEGCLAEPLAVNLDEQE